MLGQDFVFLSVEEELKYIFWKSNLLSVEEELKYIFWKSNLCRSPCLLLLMLPKTLQLQWRQTLCTILMRYQLNLWILKWYFFKFPLIRISRANFYSDHQKENRRHEIWKAKTMMVLNTALLNHHVTPNLLPKSTCHSDMGGGPN